MTNTKYGDPVSVAQIMVTDVYTLSPNMQVTQAMRELLDRNYSGAPVVDDSGAIVGVLSKKDCLQPALNAHYHHLWVGPVKNYMNTSVESITVQTDLFSAANHFINSRYRRFPVVDNEKLVGQISRSDVLEALCGYWSNIEPADNK